MNRTLWRIVHYDANLILSVISYSKMMISRISRFLEKDDFPNQSISRKGWIPESLWILPEITSGRSDEDETSVFGGEFVFWLINLCWRFWLDDGRISNILPISWTLDTFAGDCSFSEFWLVELFVLKDLLLEDFVGSSFTRSDWLFVAVNLAIFRELNLSVFKSLFRCPYKILTPTQIGKFYAE